MRPAWHVSPWIDASLSHWGWIPPLLLCIVAERYLGASSTLIFAVMFPLAQRIHRSYTYPYAYLDGEVLGRSRARLLVLPGLLLAVFATLPLVLRAARAWEIPLGTLLVTIVLPWNTWHTTMQKFGLIRLYNGKAKAEAGGEIPRWVDWCAIFGWMPLWWVFLGPKNAGYLRGVYTQSWWGFSVARLMELFLRVQAPLVAAAALMGTAFVVIWIRHERRISGFRNRARLSLMAGQTAFSLATLFVDPMITAVVVAINHSAEYVMFVTKIQKSRYGGGNQRTLMGRLYQKPLAHWLLYGLVPVASYAVYALIEYRQRTGHRLWFFAGYSLAVWYFYYDNLETMAHNWVDGIVWRLKRPEYRAAAGSAPAPAA